MSKSNKSSDNKSDSRSDISSECDSDLQLPSSKLAKSNESNVSKEPTLREKAKREKTKHYQAQKVADSLRLTRSIVRNTIFPISSNAAKVSTNDNSDDASVNSCDDEVGADIIKLFDITSSHINITNLDELIDC